MSRPENTTDHITPYDRLAWSDVQVEELLASGEMRPELAAYFGEQEYRELARLAREARKTPLKKDALRVFVLPGIMGSQLGMSRRAPLPNDVLWLDPVDIGFGKLLTLEMASQAPIVSLGVVLYTHLKLKLFLRAAGFDAVFHDYDWRLGVDDLGHQLAERLRAESGRIAIVAHSMGGLIARAALTLPGTEKVERFIMLGTPNFGSFAPVQALRGTYAVVRKIARLDMRNSAETLADKVFSTFPSLYHLLPPTGHSGATDLFDPSQWPRFGPRPRVDLLESARALERMLAPPDSRFATIVGVNQETVTSVDREHDDFVYTITRYGDGTVPTACAVLPGARTYFTPVAHSELTRHRKVADAVGDLLRTGETRRLATEWTRGGMEEARVSDHELRRTHVTKVDWAGLQPEERRVFLQTLNEPPKLKLKARSAHAHGPRLVAVRAGGAREAAKDTSDAPIDGALKITKSTAADLSARGARHSGDSARKVGAGTSPRPKRAPVEKVRPLEIRIQLGDIVRAADEALVVSVFQDVKPAGAVASIDAHLKGLIAEFTARRMLPGEAGNVVTVPAHGRLPHADEVLLAGIGRFDRLSARTIEFTAENVVRLCVRSGIKSFATVLWGNGASFPAEVSFESQLRGYLHGLAAVDPDSTLERITFCVRDKTHHRKLTSSASILLSTERMQGREIVLREKVPAASRAKAQSKGKSKATRPKLTRVESVIPAISYLLVNEQPAPDGGTIFRSALLTAGKQAAVVSEPQPFVRESLDQHLRKLESPDFKLGDMKKFGEELAALTLHQTVRAELHNMRNRPLVVVHDATASRIPWETLCIRGWFPAIEKGLSRRYAAEQLSLARFNESRRTRKDLAVLLVANPTEDLAGAELEGDRLVSLLEPINNARVTVVKGQAATCTRLLAELQSGAYDVLHYAGHAFFDERSPSRSGIQLADAVLTSLQLAELAQLPALVVFNACESARVRRDVTLRLQASHGLAEIFLRGGVANYIGTYWPVNDTAAVAFTETFYSTLLRNNALGAAVVKARSAIRELRSIDWADYIHYGDPDFRLKE
jgi:CHAT domain-containing protein/pimeloyl-ACP methyl ester carboxylesterase